MTKSTTDSSIRNTEFNAVMERIFASYISADQSTTDLIAHVTEQLLHALDIQRVGFWMFTPERDEIICNDLYESATERHHAGDRLKAADFPQYFLAMKSLRVINAHDARADVRTAEFLNSYLLPNNIRSMLDVPIQSATGICGVICCETVGYVHNWTDDEIAFVTSATQFVSMSKMADDSRELSHRLGDALVAADKASAVKSEFLANMGHELRTPLNGIMGTMQLLRMSDLTSRQLEILEMGSGASQSLSEIVGNILEFTSLKSEKLKCEKAETEIVTLVSDVVGSIVSTALEKSIAVQISGIDGVPEKIITDPVRIRQILSILLDNALKFTVEGCIAVSMDTINIDDENNFVRINVSDTGIGIPREIESELFDQFSQVNSSATRDFNGLGLGLALAKGIVEGLGGEIGYESILGKGSSFWFMVPYGFLPGSGSISSDKAADHSNDLCGRRILIRGRQRDKCQGSRSNATGCRCQYGHCWRRKGRSRIGLPQ